MKVSEQIEVTIIQKSTVINLDAFTGELSMEVLQKEEKVIQKWTALEKGKRNYDMTHYEPRFNGVREF